MPATTRRHLLAAAAGSAALGTARAARAQGWMPTRPVRIVVPYSPGGGADTTARFISGPMGEALGQSVVIENRGGAGGSIGAAEVARSAPDGTTMLVDALAHVSNPVLLPRLPFDYGRAFAPITQLIVLPQILAVPNALPVGTLAEFVAYARARPGQLTYGSSGNATAAHLASVDLLRRAGLEMQHVPYRGGTQALQDLLGGSLAFVFGTVSSTAQLAREGRVRALAVSSARRIASLPEVPTVAEQGFPGYELNEWNGLYAPAGTPAPALAALREAALRALRDPSVRARIEALGAEPVGSSTAEFAAFLAEQRTRMATLIREAGVTID